MRLAGAREEMPVEEQEGEFHSPQGRPEHTDDGELHTEEHLSVLDEAWWRGHTAGGLIIPVDDEHGMGDGLVHGTHADEEGECKEDDAIVWEELAVDLEADPGAGDGEEDGDRDGPPDQPLQREYEPLQCIEGLQVYIPADAQA